MKTRRLQSKFIAFTLLEVMIAVAIFLMATF
jgi:prepilin-type N-terminal cleavage/methylation domain-containing protein